MHEFRREVVTEEPEEPTGWRAFQPSWGEAALMSFGLTGLFGGLAYYQTGNIVALEFAAAAGLLGIVVLRWVYPHYLHLSSGDAD